MGTFGWCFVLLGLDVCLALPCLVCQRCLWLSAGAGRAQWVMQSKLLHGWLMWGAVCPAPCGRKNTPRDGCQTSGDLVPMNISPGSIYIFLWLVLTVAVVELSAERKKWLDFCSSHLPPQTCMHYLVTSLTVAKPLLDWMVGVRSAGRNKFLIYVWSSSVKIHYIAYKFFEQEYVFKA